MAGELWTHIQGGMMTGQTEDQGPCQPYGHYKLHSTKVLLAHVIFIINDRKLNISDLCHNYNWVQNYDKHSFQIYNLLLIIYYFPRLIFK